MVRWVAQLFLKIVASVVVAPPVDAFLRGTDLNLTAHFNNRYGHDSVMATIIIVIIAMVIFPKYSCLRRMAYLRSLGLKNRFEFLTATHGRTILLF